MDPRDLTPPPTPTSNDTAVTPPVASDAAAVSDVQWTALALAIARADGHAVTHVVHGTPNGDAAIQTATAEALAAKGFITITGTTAWPTNGGRRALATHRRLERRRADRTTGADQ